MRVYVRISLRMRIDDPHLATLSSQLPTVRDEEVGLETNIVVGRQGAYASVRRRLVLATLLYCFRLPSYDTADLKYL